MGTNQTITPSKSEKSSSIVQAYYGSGVPIAAPYFSAAVAPGHTYPYMWSPQVNSHSDILAFSAHVDTFWGAIHSNLSSWTLPTSFSNPCMFLLINFYIFY
ncbi:uncharacterized protein LOC110104342 isoform X3 [Dendrobium catenatum]|uniref:uncharacterized protein LOC110104342 isoform X3 n=1 Tax=Dendrobium catenatum TaxID=906689 RepID=UPI00109F8C38|nr:uncharacterized protein LOC110104342 isoform X3 [Dendrobium catenatum]